MENEIKLRQYADILYKERIMIGCFIVLGLLAAFVWLYFCPKAYQGTMTIEIGRIEGRAIENPLDLVEKINVMPVDNLSALSVSNPENTNMIKILLSAKNNNSAEKAVDMIGAAVLDSHNQKIEYSKNILSQNIENVKKDIAYLLSRGQEIAQIQLKLYNLQDAQNNYGNYYKPTSILQKGVFEKSLNRAVNLIFGGMIGLFLGVVVAIGREKFFLEKTT